MVYPCHSLYVAQHQKGQLYNTQFNMGKQKSLSQWHTHMPTFHNKLLRLGGKLITFPTWSNAVSCTLSLTLWMMEA